MPGANKWEDLLQSATPVTIPFGRNISSPADLWCFSQWSPKEDRAAISRQLSDVWLPREESFPQFRMAPCQDTVLKQGFLYKKRERSSTSFRRPWQNGYFALKKSPGFAGLLLEEFRDASLRVTKETLFLDTVKHVGPVTTSRSKQYAFQVVVLGRSPLFFACDNELLRSEWIDVFARYTDDSVEPPMTHGRRSPEGGPSARQLRQSQSTSIYVDMKSEDIGQRTSISDSKGYEVFIQKTPLSEDNDLYGNHVLQISKTRLSFKHMDKNEYILSWPFTQLRGFKSQSEQQLIILETGRRCHFGKGRLVMKTRYADAIVNDIREAIASESLSSDNSLDSEPENNHRPVSRTVSDNQCNVTVSVRPRRVHSDKVINQLAVGRSLSSRPAPISPTLVTSSLAPPPSHEIKSPVMLTDDPSEDVFRFDNTLGVFTEVKAKKEVPHKTADWKTSTTFSKTMTEWRENDNSSIDYDDNDHPYVDIIPDEKTEKPLSSDEASSLLAQVVADLTEPQKRNCFVKSNSTGGIQAKHFEVNEGRRASAPVVGSTEYTTTTTTATTRTTVSDSEPPGGASSSQRRLKLEKINEVSFIETTDGGDTPLTPKKHPTVNTLNSTIPDRPRSMSELHAIEHQTPPQDRREIHRSRTFLGISRSNIGSSLTDIYSTKHHGLRATCSFSPSSDFSQQLAKDSSHFGLAASLEKVPSFPKSRVVRAFENIGGLDNSRHMLDMSPLPPEFHDTGSFDSDKDQLSPVSPTFKDYTPPRPPKESDVRSHRSRSSSRSPPPPLPERLPSSPILFAKEKTHISIHMSLSKAYANSPPKVQPRIPNTMASHSIGPKTSCDNASPPPRPPKPESLSNSLRKTAFEQTRQSSAQHSQLNSSVRHNVTEKRSDGYHWDLDDDKDGNLGKAANPLVTVTPPRSLKFSKHKVPLMRGLSQSDSDIIESLENPMKSILESSRSVPHSGAP